MLTRVQWDVFGFVKEQIGTSGVAPSYRAIARFLGNERSVSRAAHVVAALEERGFIRRIRGRSHSIEIVERPSEVMKERLRIARLVVALIPASAYTRALLEAIHSGKVVADQPFQPGAATLR